MTPRNHICAPRRVFIVERLAKLAGSATRPAERFGEIVDLYFPGEARPSVWSVDYVPDVVRRLREHDYDPRHDYVLMTGPSVNLIMVATGLVAMYEREREVRGWTPVKVLYWCGSTRDYVERYLGLSPAVHSEMMTA